MNNKESSTRTRSSSSSSLLKNEEQPQDSDVTIFICENTNGILDPMEQMTYALNETQIRYGSVVVLKNAP
ncbi:hypothetical protein [Nitrososphaera viennensis]|uniref:Uncharacterized protein n=2 Tax=Nitrososphaera viennensis TaxID=1034015 RepID=A0A060HL21_9ARCH|nr:hypothetical protein [Nitrososphaera viennensis]AIC17219.1 hypothetical protein NVIE_029410 [Nitrososphaera viennensis EN76]UVS69106.1 hypothetical protein NWT39_14525 [Nitrososphaera viennensis]